MNGFRVSSWARRTPVAQGLARPVRTPVAQGLARPERTPVARYLVPSGRTPVARAARVAPALFLLAAGACAFEPGHGFGVVDAAVGAGLAVPAEREVAGGVKTDQSYVVRLDAATLHVDSVRLLGAADAPAAGAGTAVFDPANPPPGYSLCHGGHCHSEDGDLVSYEDIAAELASGGGVVGPSTFLELPVDRAFDLLDAATAHPVAACVPGCEVGRGRVTEVAFLATRLEVTGSIEDPSTLDRLAGETVDLTIDLRLAGLSLSSTLAEPLVFDRGEAPFASVELVLQVDPALFDDVEWASHAAGGAVVVDADLAEAPHPELVEQLMANLERAQVEATVDRADHW